MTAEKAGMPGGRNLRGCVSEPSASRLWGAVSDCSSDSPGSTAEAAGSARLLPEQTRATVWLGSTAYSLAPDLRALLCLA